MAVREQIDDNMRRNVLLVLGGLAALPGLAQLQVSTSMTPVQLVQNILVGGGVAVSNITYNGVASTSPQVGSGSFSNGNATNLGLNSGVILTSGLASDINHPSSFFASTTNNTGSDPDLAAITTPGNIINDRAVLEFDFVPNGDSVKFNYVFGSEEYPDFNCNADYNDVFGFFLSGPGISGAFTNNAINLARVPGTSLPVSIANIHGSELAGCSPANVQYYVTNANGTTIAFGGFTVVLQAMAQVICGETYHIKLAIGDAGDSGYDSGVFLEAGSFSSNALPTLAATTISGDGTVSEGCTGSLFTISRPQGVDSTISIGYIMTGTASLSDYEPMPNPAVIPEGQNSVDLPFHPSEDGIAEGPETAILNVFVVNACGDSLFSSIALVIIDYNPVEIQLEPNILLQCDQDSVPIYASFTGGVGQTFMIWNDSLPGNVIWVPGQQDGTYTVSVTDECPNTVSAQVHVDAGCAIIIPNVITPNGDGHNDRFVIKGIEGRNNQVRLYNRWGQEVLNAHNYVNTFSAKDLHDGVYFYLVRVLDKEYTGSLQVLGGKL